MAATADDDGAADEPVRRRATIYRESDSPPRHDDQALAAAGIQKYESERLTLYTDIDPELARPLPELMDRCYEAWVEYFGPLPPNREGTEFRMTGYLMADQRLFRETGLLPENLPPFPHGRHRGTRFWLNDQPTDYYRRHLLLHEGTHCYMTAVRHPLMQQVWYLEGMAELFGTHRFDPDGHPQFRVLPDNREDFAGLGRIRLVEDEVREQGPRSLTDVLGLVPDQFLNNPAYAWSWALCQFLDGHPRYRERFRRAGAAVVTGELTADWNELFGGAPSLANAVPAPEEPGRADSRDLQEEWLLFAANLCHGYDQQRSAIDFRAGRALAVDDAAKVEVAADRGWQSSGIDVAAGNRYRLTADGRFVIARSPAAVEESQGRMTAATLSSRGSAPERKGDADSLRLWECEPQGISIRYHAGRPLGMLLAAIRSPLPPGAASTTVLDVIPVGREATFAAPVAGTLYLRVNDAWSELWDNSGSVSVSIVGLAASPARDGPE